MRSASSVPHCWSGLTRPTMSPSRPAGMSERPGAPNAVAMRRTGRSRHTGGCAARGQFLVVAGTRRCHPGARKLSMNSATSSISWRSSSSASSAADSAAAAARRCSCPTLSRMARRKASDQVRPVDSSCARARSASGRSQSENMKTAPHLVCAGKESSFLVYVQEPLARFPCVNGFS